MHVGLGFRAWQAVRPCARDMSTRALPPQLSLSTTQSCSALARPAQRHELNTAAWRAYPSGFLCCASPAFLFVALRPHACSLCLCVSCVCWVSLWMAVRVPVSLRALVSRDVRVCQCVGCAIGYTCVPLCAPVSVWVPPAGVGYLCVWLCVPVPLDVHVCLCMPLCASRCDSVCLARRGFCCPRSKPASGTLLLRQGSAGPVTHKKLKVKGNCLYSVWRHSLRRPAGH